MNTIESIAYRAAPASRRSPRRWISAGLLIGLLLTAPWARADSASPTGSCTGLSRATLLEQSNIDIGAGPTKSATLALPANRLLLIEAVEFGVDVTASVGPASGVQLPVDNPVRRSGVQRALIHTGPSGAVTVTAIAKVHPGSGSRIEVRVIDVDAAGLTNGCRAVIDAVTTADAAYAKAQMISTGQSGAPAASAADLYAQAHRDYESAFLALNPNTELPLRAELAHAIAALLYQDLKQERESELWSQRAAALFGAAGDPYGQARAQALQAAAWMELAALPNANTATEATRHDSQALLRRANDLLEKLARFHQARGELFDAALQRNNIGLASYYGGAYEAALRAYAKALSLYEQLGYAYGRAQVTQNMAVADWDLGRVTAALAAYQHALTLLTVDDSPKLYADVLINCGFANVTAGHLDIALAQHSRALELAIRTQSHQQQARSLFGIAAVYNAAGDHSQAKEFLHEALDIWGRYADTRSAVGALRALALIEAKEGHGAESVRLDREALRDATDAATRVRLLVQIADSELLQAQPAAANQDLSLASQIAASADPVSQAAVALEHGILEFREGHLDGARRSTLTALALDRSLGLAAPTFDAIVALARIEASAGHPATALRYLDRGLNLSEAMRVRALDPELRATSMRPLRAAFDMEVDLWVQRYQHALAAGDRAGAELAARAALDVTERFRVRAMQDIALADYAHASAAALSPLLARKSELIRDIAAHEYRLEEDGVRAATAAIRTDISHLREQLALVDTQLAALGGGSTGQGSTGTPVRVDRLPTDTAVVSYWLGESGAYSWIATESSLSLVNLGATAAIGDAARAAHAAFADLTTTSVDDRISADERMSQMVLRPVLPFVPPGITRLAIVPDGPLHYLSFAVLPMRTAARDSYLIRQYELAYGSSMGSLLRQRMVSNPTDDRMLLVDDAVYGRDDPRLPRNAGESPLTSANDPPPLRSGLVPTELERLPATAEEAAAIARAAPPTALDRLEGFAATRDAVLGRSLERYRYIHFAVHATTDAGIPQLSSLIFSTYDSNGRSIENRVWAGDLMTKRFNAATVVLSGCETALGTDIGGEGLLGLRYVVLARGAQSVVASLWSVPDRTTEALMQAFYRGLLQEHRRPESALALAMRQSLREGPRDPALWAGFTATIASVD